MNRERPVARGLSVSATSHLFALRWDGGRGKFRIALEGDFMYSLCDTHSLRSTLSVVMVSVAGRACTVASLADVDVSQKKEWRRG